jgi:hypothetical protein
MDQAVQLIIGMNQWIWSCFKDDLKDVTPEEIDWRPLSEANNIIVIVRHPRIEAAWHLASLELDTVDFQRNLKGLGESCSRFVAVLSQTTAPALEHSTLVAYQNFPGGVSRPMHLLGFHQALHLATHLGQMRSIRNLYRKTRGEPARFFPQNPTFPNR